MSLNGTKRKSLLDNKLVRHTLGFTFFFIVYIGIAAFWLGIWYGVAMLAITVTPWLLVIGIPVGLFLMGLTIALGIKLIEMAFAWVD